MSRLRVRFQLHQFEDRVNPPLPLRRREAKNARIKTEQFLRVEKLVIVGQLRQIPDALAGDRLPHIHAKNRGRPAGGVDESQQHIHRRGLPRAVGSQKSKNFPRLHPQIQAVHRAFRAPAQIAAGKLHPQICDFQDRVHWRNILSARPPDKPRVAGRGLVRVFLKIQHERAKLLQEILARVRRVRQADPKVSVALCGIRRHEQLLIHLSVHEVIPVLAAATREKSQLAFVPPHTQDRRCTLSRPAWVRAEWGSPWGSPAFRRRG